MVFRMVMFVTPSSPGTSPGLRVAGQAGDISQYDTRTHEALAIFSPHQGLWCSEYDPSGPAGGAGVAGSSTDHATYMATRCCGVRGSLSRTARVDLGGV